MSTIYEVASLAGVSPKTAARILAGAKGRPANQAKVLEAAEKLGYIRNQHAASLRSKQSGLIGLIVPDIANPQYPLFCRYAYDAALRNGYRIILANTYGNAEEEAAALRMFQSVRIEALMLNCAEGEPDETCDELIRSLLKGGTPVLIGGRPLRGIPADQIIIRNEGAIRKVVDHLVSRGRRKIAFLSGARGLMATEERFEGFQAAMKANGLPIEEKHLSFCDFTTESGFAQTMKLLEMKKSERPDAIVCGNDLIALGAIQAAYEKQVRIPDELSVVGFDDISIARIVRPYLTTIHQPLERMANEGIELLLDRIQRKDTSSPRTLYYDLDLVVRESA